jgi:hypothetical protein
VVAATSGPGWPRAWTLYLAEMAGAALPDELPAQWLEHARQEAGEPVPERLSEPALPGGAGDAVARSIEAVRTRIFPLHGLA